MPLNDIIKKLQPVFLSILRVVIGLQMVQHGTQKVFHFPAPTGQFPESTLSFVAGCIEIILGIPFILGLFVRPIALIFSGEMAIAYFLRHAPRGLFVPINNGGDLALTFCFVYLFLTVAGGGKIGVDALWHRRDK